MRHTYQTDIANQLKETKDKLAAAQERIRTLETENAQFLRIIMTRLEKTYQDEVVDPQMEDLLLDEDQSVELFKTDWLATELEAWLIDASAEVRAVLSHRLLIK